MDEPPAAATATRTFPARLAIVPETASFVEDYCACHGVDRNATLRLALIVEELFANTIMHGHRTECDAPITLTLRLAPEGVELLYEDTAREFDLIAALSEPTSDIDAELESRPVGNMGLRLLGHFSGNGRYARESGRNRVWLTVRRAG